MDSVREIKYRAWREDIEVMEDVRELVWDNNGLKKQTGEQFLNIVGFREFESYTGAGDLKNVVLMQFTGLTDVNGKEIYEGDILDECGYVVAFVDGTDGAALGMPMGWYEQRDDFESYRQLEVGDIKEVVGNVHQHRYLLKEKN